jgi:farnesyl diphosphate synthase
MYRHRLIVIYKTAFYSFYLPVALAMYMTGIPTSYPASSAHSSTRPYEVALSILVPLGEYFQIQDDFLDFSADPETLGKVGTDIIDNKCSWCINTALSVASKEQREVLYANYGQKDAEKENRVKEVFEAIGMRDRYKTYEAKAYGDIMKTINEKVPPVDGGGDVPVLKREVFTSFLEKIYKRTK